MCVTPFRFSHFVNCLFSLFTLLSLFSFSPFLFISLILPPFSWYLDIFKVKDLHCFIYINIAYFFYSFHRCISLFVSPSTFFSLSLYTSFQMVLKYIQGQEGKVWRLWFRGWGATWNVKGGRCEKIQPISLEVKVVQRM